MRGIKQRQELGENSATFSLGAFANFDGFPEGLFIYYFYILLEHDLRINGSFILLEWIQLLPKLYEITRIYKTTEYFSYSFSFGIAKNVPMM